MNCGAIVIRISTGDEATDWTVQRPYQISFNDALLAISQVIPNTTVSAFEYEDEDGDRITVKSDDEMAVMLTEYVSRIEDAGGGGGECVPLIIYPRVGKPSVKRNIHNLKVATPGKEETASCRDAGSPVEQEQGSRKRSGDIREILAGGQISDADLCYLEILGSGNCGTVYKAQHRPSGVGMAVKVIPLDISVDAQKQIISELEVLHRCHSPVIIAFYGAFFVENRISICTEFMDGGSLDKYGQIPEDILGRMAVSMVKGLQYLWSLKIMHRDVKPSNTLVNTQGQVKLCDFGVSVQLIDSIAKTFIGTNAYMAPERINGQQYSIHSEVWSLGISLFELASGRFPYESAKRAASKPIDLLKSIVEKVPPQLPRGAFSDAFVDFVAQCMQKMPLARPAPQDLMRHPFIATYDDDNMAVVAAWVRTRQQDMALQLQHKANSA